MDQVILSREGTIRGAFPSFGDCHVSRFVTYASVEGHVVKSGGFIYNFKMVAKRGVRQRRVGRTILVNAGSVRVQLVFIRTIGLQVSRGVIVNYFKGLVEHLCVVVNIDVRLGDQTIPVALNVCNALGRVVLRT